MTCWVNIDINGLIKLRLWNTSKIQSQYTNFKNFLRGMPQTPLDSACFLMHAKYARDCVLHNLLQIQHQGPHFSSLPWAPLILWAALNIHFTDLEKPFTYICNPLTLHIVIDKINMLANKHLWKKISQDCLNAWSIRMKQLSCKHVSTNGCNRGIQCILEDFVIRLCEFM